MGWPTGIALYVVIWWIALFAILPLWTRPVAGADPLTGWRGVPERPRLLKKFLATSILAAVLWGLWYLLVISDWLSFRTGWLAIGDK
jgi:predicted secreted protein